MDTAYTQDDPVSVLELSIKPARALRLLGVNTIQELLLLDAETIREVPGCGTLTVEAVRQQQRLLLRRGVVVTAGDPAGTDRDMHESFRTLVSGLPGRAARALETLGVSMVDQLRSLEPGRVLQLRGMGIGTVDAIRALQLSLSSEDDASVETPVLRSDALQPVAAWHGLFDENVLRTLPLFIGIASATPADLHESYCPTEPVATLGLPHRAEVACLAGGIETVGQLLCTPYTAFLKSGKRGTVALAATQQVLLTHLKERNGLGPTEDPLNMASFEDFTEAVMRRCITRERPREILRHRIGVDSGSPSTLEQVGMRYGLTRERVRQIEAVGLRELASARAQGLLGPALTVIRAFFSECGGIAFATEAADGLAERFSWRATPGPSVLVGLMEACDHRYHVTANRVQTEHPCRRCVSARTALERLVDQRGRVSTREVKDALHVHCTDACEDGQTKALRPSDAFVRELVASQSATGSRLYTSNGTICGTLRSDDSLSRKCALVVIRAARPTHYLEVWKAMTENGGHQLPPLRVHAYLAGDASLLMWDRGVFVHKDDVHYDGAFVSQIARTAAAKLHGALPFLSVFGLFNECRSEGIAAGIPNDHALYSVLGKDAASLLACDRYPFIRLLGPTAERVSARDHIEAIVREADGPIPVVEVRRRLCEQLGLRLSHCNQAINQAMAVCNAGDGYLIHLDHLNVSGQSMSPIIEHALSLLHKCEHLSVARVFDDKRATCVSQGISTPRLLYDLLGHFASGKLLTKHYPQIRLRDDDSESTVHDEIVNFVKETDRAVSVQEINAIFVEARGYRPGTVYQVTNSSSLCWYYPECVIHPETLGLTDVHRQRLIEEAQEFYAQSSLASDYWSLIDTFLEMKENALPPLMNGAGWTDLLAYSILSRAPAVRIVGNTRLAYVTVPNRWSIATLGDLCATVVEEVFGGGCSMDQLSDYLVSGRAIRKRLTTFMLCEIDRLAIKDDQVCLKELVS